MRNMEAKMSCLSTYLEPVNFLLLVSYGVVYGSEVQTNLKLWKVCHLIFNHTEAVCQNLSAHNDVQNEVQKYVTQFDLWGKLLADTPSLAYCIFAGALSDKYDSIV